MPPEVIDHDPTPTPRVSVIIPTLNRATLLPHAVHSVLGQTYIDLELIIVDDGSTDDTQAVIADLVAADARVKTLRHAESQGQPAAFNSGIKVARGEYLSFLDDDDRWLPHKLTGQVTVLDSAPLKVGAVYCWYDWVDADTGRVTRPKERWTHEGDISRYCVAMRQPGCQTMLLIRASAVREVMFDESIAVGNDLDFNLRLSRRCHYRLYPRVAVHISYNHGHTRMTDDLPDTIAYYQRHITVNREELRALPADLAFIYTRIGHMQLLVGDLRGSVEAFLMALRINFWRELFRYIVKAPKMMIALSLRILRRCGARWGERVREAQRR